MTIIIRGQYLMKVDGKWNVSTAEPPHRESRLIWYDDTVQAMVDAAEKLSYLTAGNAMGPITVGLDTEGHAITLVGDGPTYELALVTPGEKLECDTTTMEDV